MLSPPPPGIPPAVDAKGVMGFIAGGSTTARIARTRYARSDPRLLLGTSGAVHVPIVGPSVVSASG